MSQLPVERGTASQKPTLSTHNGQQSGPAKGRCAAPCSVMASFGLFVCMSQCLTHNWGLITCLLDKFVTHQLSNWTHAPEGRDHSFLVSASPGLSTQQVAGPE